MPACIRPNYIQEWTFLLWLQKSESFKRTGYPHAKRLKTVDSTRMMLKTRKFPKTLMEPGSYIYWLLSLRLLIYTPLYAIKSPIPLKWDFMQSGHYGQAISCQHKQKLCLELTAVNIYEKKKNKKINWLQLSDVIDISNIQPSTCGSQVFEVM